MAWSKNQNFTLAVGSYREDYTNRVDLVKLVNGSLQRVGGFDHDSPPTKIGWREQSDGKEILITAGDKIRLWDFDSSYNAKNIQVLGNGRGNKDHFTGFDTSPTDPHILAVSSVDTTVTLFDSENPSKSTTIIAHDKEVYDIAWNPQHNQFATAGADGSVRLFDPRDFSTCSVLCEDPHGTPFIQVSWSNNGNYLAALKLDSNVCTILDRRYPCVTADELVGHSDSINGVTWAPHMDNYLCTASDDDHALIWNVGELPRHTYDPVMAYKANSSINHVSWNRNDPDWIGVVFGTSLQVLKI
eukprot:TRINITY_DN6631_c0_g1_i1.p1 TRINITY_DN6631_c0_g1~~TRINITY_DN6631_c0_g1_i1.p1  ORF type:complete len:324 (+),score=50.80 TRINITY_DN6631_c0_g1_i1:74-973(+)